MRTTYMEQLQTLHKDLIDMGAMCEEAISKAVYALTSRDESLIEEVRRVDSGIDKKERDIEAQCLQLYLRQQPVASDLRKISAALKMISDMERIGDQASDIAEIARYLIRRPERPCEDVKQMAREAISMVTDAVDAFVMSDLALARRVMAYDDVVDGLFVKVKEELIAEVSRDGSKGSWDMDLLMIAKYLERIGDHATNIAEWVEFSLTGVRSKDGVPYTDG